MRLRKSGTNESLKLKGVYSTPFEAKGKDGGATLRKIYWGVWVVGSDVFEIQPLNQNMVPMGQRQRISRADFERQFTPEPDFFITRSSFDIPTGGDAGQPTERRAHAGDLADDLAGDLVEDEAAQGEIAIEAVSREMEALQTEGRSQLKRGDLAQALDTFRRILALQGPFVPEHKFVFNGCGIDMRKAEQLDEAIAFYKKALEVDQADENLCHNIARALYDQGDLNAALEYLRLGLSMNPDFKEARRFASFIEKRQGKAGQARNKSDSSRYALNAIRERRGPAKGGATSGRGGPIDLDAPASPQAKTPADDSNKPSGGTPASKKVYRF